MSNQYESMSQEREKDLLGEAERRQLVRGLRAVLGEGSPVSPPLVLWLAVAVPFVAALTVLGRMCLWGGRLSGWVFKRGTWALTAVLGLVSAMNFAGGSSWESLLGAFTLSLALLCAIVAVSEPGRGVDGPLSLERHSRLSYRGRAGPDDAEPRVS